MTFFLMGGALVFVSRTHTLLVAFIVLGSVLFLLRLARIASVELGADEVIIWGLRTQRIPRSRIVGVEVVRGSSADPWFDWRVPAFQLDDGSVVPVDHIRSLRTGTIVDAVVAEARRRLGDTGADRE